MVLLPPVAKGSRFTLGVWGWDVFARRRLHPSITVRDEFAMAVPLAGVAKAVTFGCFKLRAASFRAAGVALNVTSQHVS